LIDVDLNPCLYQILTSMDGSEMAWELTKQEVHVIQVNPTKPMKYIINYGLKLWSPMLCPMTYWLEEQFCIL
jgi:hypothetical protein